LTLGIKFEPQSLHWTKNQISVHLGILKCNGNKSYHPYVSDCRVHDQSFVKLVVYKMLENTPIPDDSVVIIESDNCSSQFKSGHHFVDMQELANQFQHKVIRVYGIAGHSKSEVDHVGGIAKVAVRDEVARGELFTGAREVFAFLQAKFGHKENPNYVIRNIEVQELEAERKRTARTVYKTISGSSSFHVMIFSPFADHFRASPCLCLCDACQEEYGSCSLFNSYELSTSESSSAKFEHNTGQIN